jgi:hypothetical protein
MNVKCPVCGGDGKVTKEFGLGECKKIKDDPDHHICPGCDGKGIQYEQDRNLTYPTRTIVVKKPRPKPDRYMRG